MRKDLRICLGWPDLRESPESRSHILSNTWICICQTLFYALFDQVETSRMFKMGLMVSFLLQQSFQPSGGIGSRLNILVLACGKDMLHNSNIVRNLADDDIDRRITLLGADLLCTTAQLDQVLEKDFDHGIQSWSSRSCYFLNDAATFF